MEFSSAMGAEASQASVRISGVCGKATKHELKKELEKVKRKAKKKKKKRPKNEQKAEGTPATEPVEPFCEEARQTMQCEIDSLRLKLEKMQQMYAQLQSQAQSHQSLQQKVSELQHELDERRRSDELRDAVAAEEKATNEAIEPQPELEPAEDAMTAVEAEPEPQDKDDGVALFGLGPKTSTWILADKPTGADGQQSTKANVAGGGAEKRRSRRQSQHPVDTFHQRLLKDGFITRESTRATKSTGYF